jgi:RND family efflux transporter MFP subunit
MRTTVTAAALLSLALLSGCASQQAKTVAATEAPPVAAAIVTVKAEPFTLAVPVTGTLISNARVDVKAETTGRVVRFDKEEGAAVAAGETIAWVNDENFHLAQRQAETSVKVAEAALERARVNEQHSRSELERARNLERSGGITEKDLKAAQLAESDGRAQVQVAAAQVEQARAVLALARKQLRDTEIKAPVAGVIQKKYINKGAYVEPATAVIAIVDNHRLELESPVAAADLAPVRTGQRVAFTVNSYPDLTFEGAVIEVNPMVEPETRSARVRIRVANPGGKLKAGMFAEGEIQTGVVPAAIVVPADAVYRDDATAKTSYVFVAENGAARRRPVAVGRERAGRLQIAEGLRPGDLLIAEQNIQIAEGVRVAARK